MHVTDIIGNLFYMRKKNPLKHMIYKIQESRIWSIQGNLEKKKL